MVGDVNPASTRQDVPRRLRVSRFFGCIFHLCGLYRPSPVYSRRPNLVALLARALILHLPAAYLRWVSSTVFSLSRALRVPARPDRVSTTPSFSSFDFFPEMIVFPRRVALRFRCPSPFAGDIIRSTIDSRSLANFQIRFLSAFSPVTFFVAQIFSPLVPVPGRLKRDPHRSVEKFYGRRPRSLSVRRAVLLSSDLPNDGPVRNGCCAGKSPGNGEVFSTVSQSRP